MFAASYLLFVLVVTQSKSFNDLHYKLRLTTTGKSFASHHGSKSVVIISIDVNSNLLLSMALSRSVGGGGGGGEVEQVNDGGRKTLKVVFHT